MAEHIAQRRALLACDAGLVDRPHEIGRRVQRWRNIALGNGGAQLGPGRRRIGQAAADRPDAVVGALKAARQRALVVVGAGEHGAVQTPHTLCTELAAAVLECVALALRDGVDPGAHEIAVARGGRVEAWIVAVEHRARELLAIDGGLLGRRETLRRADVRLGGNAGTVCVGQCARPARDEDRCLDIRHVMAGVLERLDVGGITIRILRGRHLDRRNPAVAALHHVVRPDNRSATVGLWREAEPIGVELRRDLLDLEIGRRTAGAVARLEVAGGRLEIVGVRDLVGNRDLPAGMRGHGGRVPGTRDKGGRLGRSGLGGRGRWLRRNWLAGRPIGKRGRGCRRSRRRL